MGWAGGLMQEQALGRGPPSLPNHEAEQPDCPVPRPSGLSTATRPHGSAGGRTVVLCVGAHAGLRELQGGRAGGGGGGSQGVHRACCYLCGLALGCVCLCACMGRVVVWGLACRGQCGLVLQARWGGHGGLSPSPPGELWARASLPPRHRDMLPAHPTTAGARGRAASGTTGGNPRSLTARRHRWRCCDSWVPHPTAWVACGSWRGPRARGALPCPGT